MKVLQFLLGLAMLTLGAYVFYLGWQDYHSESSRMARIMAENLRISRPFWKHPGVLEMAAGCTGGFVGGLLMVTTFRPLRG